MLLTCVGVSINWNTYINVPINCVRYGQSPHALTQLACSESSATYPTARTWFHSVYLDNLTPSTTYYYCIGASDKECDTFLSPRQPGDTTPFNMNVVIDLGVYGEDGFTIANDHSKRDMIPDVPPSMNHSTIDRLAQTIDDYELVIHPGDLGYADDWMDKKHNLDDGKMAFQAILEQFYDQLAPISGRKHYMTSPGNHEAACQLKEAHLCPEGQNNFTDYMMRFREALPTAFESTSTDSKAKVNANKAKHLAKPPFWYSFEYGMAHVVMIDTETDFAGAPDGVDGSDKLNSGPFGATNQQLEFLEADLASVDRDVTPWVIVSGHRPWYTVGDEVDPCIPCQAAFEDIMYKHGVDIGVFGHVHNSQRFMPVYRNKADPNGMNNPKAPMYIIAGGPGNIEGLVKIGKKPSYNAFAYDEHFAYPGLNFLDKEHLQVQFYQSTTGEVIDSTTLYKKHDQRFVHQGVCA